VNRSDRTYSRAFHHALWTVFFLVLCVAFGVWAAMAVLSDHWGQIPLWIAAVAAFLACMAEARETTRLQRIARQEETFEWKCSVIPRL